jgi:hypothetical protein
MRFSFSSLIYLISSSLCCCRLRSFSCLRIATCSSFCVRTNCFMLCALATSAFFCSLIISACCALSSFSRAASVAFATASYCCALARAFVRSRCSASNRSCAAYRSCSRCSFSIVFACDCSWFRCLTATTSSAFFFVSSIFFHACPNSVTVAYLLLFHLKQSNSVGK